MTNLFLLKETISNGYNPEILDVISLIAIFCGISVIIIKNPIVSVLYLIGLFGSVSCYLISLGLSFIGLSYLIVYIGAVSILFLFILMLINIRVSELQSNTGNNIPLAIIMAIALNNFLFQLLPYSISILNTISPNFRNIFYNIFSDESNKYLIKKYNNLYSENISSVTSTIWDSNLSENNHIVSIGNIMYTNYNMWLLIVSLILLLAMVGAIVITIKPRN